MREPVIELTITISSERLDKALAEHFNGRFSRSQIKTLIDAGHITINGAPAKAAAKLKMGDKVCIQLPLRDEAAAVTAEVIPLNVVYEDELIAVIDKPAGMTVHPGVHNERGTLLAAMLSRWPEIAQMNVVAKRVGIVHRLDKDTSGLIVIARQDSARRNLMAQFAAHTIDKVYLALLENTPKHKSGRIDAPLARDSADSRRMTISRGGDPAVSDYEIIETFTTGHALARIKLLTGRTHQIRVHMASINCPLVGDKMYGLREQKFDLRRHFLHAMELHFDHPATKKRLIFTSPLPPELQRILQIM